VVLAGVDEGVAHALTVHGDRGLIGVLLDDGEEVAQQPALRLAELGQGRIQQRVGQIAVVGRLVLAGE
jgi:hypothetical protein